MRNTHPVGLALLLLFIVLGIFLMKSNREEEFLDARAELRRVVMTIPDYETHRDDYERLMEHVHLPAAEKATTYSFPKNSRWQSRWQRRTFSQEQYVKAALVLMMEAARNEGERDLSITLSEFRLARARGR